MTMFSALSASFTGMRAQSDAFRAISDNIVNILTPGYKSANTRFHEMISEVGRTANRITQTHMGVKPVTQFFMDRQGTIDFTGDNLDVAIQGKGFFISSTTADSTGDIELTRNGQIGTTSINDGTEDQLFLTDSKGNFLLAWPTDENGDFVIGEDVSSLEAIRIDQNAFSIVARASTEALLQLNLNAEAATGESFDADIGIFDEVGEEHNANFSFVKTANLNEWEVTATVDDGVVTTAQPITMTFDETGAIVSPTTQSLDITFTNTDGGSTTVAVDFSTMKQFAADFTILDLSSDGNANGLLDSVNFDATGAVIGNFSNGNSRALYKLPIAFVQEPNKLQLRFNTHYATTFNSGGITLFEADKTGIADFVPSALEASTADLATELNNMIIAQQSFSSNGQAFRAVDEMTRIAGDLKK